jgi:hypothetical protein
LIVLVRTAVHLMRNRLGSNIAPVAALFVSWVVLIGTFNAFSWSVGLAFFMLIVALARLGKGGDFDA